MTSFLSLRTLNMYVPICMGKVCPILLNMSWSHTGSKKCRIENGGCCPAQLEALFPYYANGQVYVSLGKCNSACIFGPVPNRLSAHPKTFT